MLDALSSLINDLQQFIKHVEKDIYKKKCVTKTDIFLHTKGEDKFLDNKKRKY